MGDVVRGRARRWWATFLSVLLAVTGIVMATAPATPAGALTITDCRPIPVGGDDPFGTSGIPEATNDYLGTTEWNRSLFVPAPGILDDDVVSVNNSTTREGLTPFVTVGPRYGDLVLEPDGQLTYIPHVFTTSAPTDVRDQFTYIAYNWKTGLCSEPAIAEVDIKGYAEDVEQAPVAVEDTYPVREPSTELVSIGEPVVATSVRMGEALTVPAPGLLANDINSVSEELNDNLEARLVSEPKWDKTFFETGGEPPWVDDPAGTVSDWGVRTVGSDTFVDNSGGFTYRPPDHGYGRAVFKYRACYVVRTTAATACSKSQTATIRVARQQEARPLTMLVGTDGRGRLTRTQLLAARSWNTSAAPKLAVSAPPTGSFTQNADGSLSYDAGGAFDTPVTVGYRWCYERAGCSPSTNYSTISLVPASIPRVISATIPTRASGSFTVLTDQLVKGVDAASLGLQDVTATLSGTGSGNPVIIPVSVTCKARLDLGLTGSNTNCLDEADTLFIQPASPMVQGHTYSLRVNADGVRNIVSLAQGLPLEPFTNLFLADFRESVPPKAAPVATPADTWSNAPVTVAWHWSDDGSGVDPANCTTTSSSTGQGIQTLTASCKDFAGNTGNAAYVVKVDTEKPVAAPTQSAAFGPMSFPVTVDWNWSDATSGFDASACPASATTTVTQTYTVTATCTDRAGNVATASHEFVFDNQPPVASPTASPSGTWANGPVTITWNWSDAGGSGLDPANCPATTVVEEQGVTDVGALCTDMARNRINGVYRVRIDPVAPTATPVLSSIANWSKDPVTVTWNWTDTGGSGIDPANCTTESTSSGEGSQFVTATCTDRAGNVGSEAWGVQVDTHGPYAAPVASPAGEWSSTPVTVNWNWTDDLSGVDPDACTSSSTSAGPGEQALTATCSDVAGNTSTATQVVRIDGDSPTAAPTAPSGAGTWSRTPVTVTWNWSDGGVGVDPANCPATSTSSGDGKLTVSATCADLAGNSVTKSFDVWVDATAPVLSPTITPNPLLLGVPATASPNASDATSGVASASCGAVDTTTVGNRTVRCTATDVAGNTTSVDVPYSISLGVKWVFKQTEISAKAGAVVAPVWQLIGADGKPLADAAAAKLVSSCSVRVRLGTQAPVCAGYAPRPLATFFALFLSKTTYPVGTTVPLTISVVSGTTTVASTTVSLTVKK